MGGAQPLAVTLNGGAVLIVDVDESRLARRVEHGYLDEYTTDLDEAVARVVAAKNEGARSRSASSATPRSVFPELLLRGTPIDIVTDQTSAHDPLAYLPVGVDVDDWQAEAERDPEGFTARARGSMAKQVAAMVGFQDAGAEVFDYGNSIRARGAARRLRAGVRVPRLRAGVHPAAVRRGSRARSAGWRSRATRKTSARPTRPSRSSSPTTPGSCRWLDKAGDDRALRGAARAHLLARLPGAPPRRAEVQRDGRLGRARRARS